MISVRTKSDGRNLQQAPVLEYIDKLLPLRRKLYSRNDGFIGIQVNKPSHYMHRPSWPTTQGPISSISIPPHQISARFDPLCALSSPRLTNSEHA
jgi:hypothetical protein